MDENLLSRGISAVMAGNNQEARRLLEEAIRAAPNDERTWGWFYNVCVDDEERLRCLREMLRIYPANKTANHKLNELTNLYPEIAGPPAPPETTVQSPQPAEKIEEKGLQPWEKILLPVLIVIAVVSVGIFILIVSGVW